jgi:hypothetical protein
MCSIVFWCFLLKRNGTWSTSLGVPSGLSRWVSIPEEGLQPLAPYAVWEKPRMPRWIGFINTSSPHVTTSTYQLRFEFVSNCTVAKPALSHFKCPWTNSESYVDVAWCCISMHFQTLCCRWRKSVKELSCWDMWVAAFARSQQPLVPLEQSIYCMPWNDFGSAEWHDHAGPSFKAQFVLASISSDAGMALSQL